MAKNGEKWRWRISLFHLSNSPLAPPGLGLGVSVRVRITRVRVRVRVMVKVRVRD